MSKKLKEITKFLSWFWFFGGGLVLSLLGLVWTWKLALIIFCVWGGSLIIIVVVAVGEIISEREEAKKQKNEKDQSQEVSSR